MNDIALDAAGHSRSPATTPGYRQGRPTRKKGLRYPADPPTIEEIVAVMRVAGDRLDGLRLRALIVLLWRAGHRIGEASPLRSACGQDRRHQSFVRWACANASMGACVHCAKVRGMNENEAAWRVPSLTASRPDQGL